MSERRHQKFSSRTSNKRGSIRQGQTPVTCHLIKRPARQRRPFLSFERWCEKGVSRQARVRLRAVELGSAGVYIILGHGFSHARTRGNHLLTFRQYSS